MSQILSKKGFRGFTLIELLVVIAIIGLLSSIIAAPIQNARKKAKDAKKVAELKSTELALEQFAEANNGNYPTALSQLAPIYMPVLSSYATANVPVKDRFAYVYYTGTPNGSTVPQIFGYHIAVKTDVFSNNTLDNDRDCNGTIAGGVLSSPNCTFFNSTAAPTATYPNFAAGMLCGNGADTPGVTATVGACSSAVDGGDIGILFDGATSTCTSVNDCMFDLSNQQ